jgi:cytochrome c553
MFDSISQRRLGSCVLLSLMMATLSASADDGQGASGAAIYKYCKNCHGERGAGGESGKYPRVAGLPAAYVDKQLHDFKAQRRVNKPMIPIFKHHRFDEQVIDTVSEHIAAMSPPDLSLWPYQPDASAVAYYGSKPALAAAGATLYQSECARCHGSDGAGTPEAPPLTHQYPTYLSKQIRDFASGQRDLPSAAQCGSPDDAQTEALLNQLVELGKG